MIHHCTTTETAIVIKWKENYTSGWGYVAVGTLTLYLCECEMVQLFIILSKVLIRKPFIEYSLCARYSDKHLSALSYLTLSITLESLFNSFFTEVCVLLRLSRCSGLK